MKPNAAKIADAMIAESRGIITKPRQKAADTIQATVTASGYVMPHVMSIDAYKARFNASSKQDK